MGNTIRHPVILNRDSKEAKDYWLARLSGVEGSPGLVPYFPRPKEFSERGGRYEFQITDSLLGSIRKLTSNGSFLLCTCLVAALKTYFYKYNNHRQTIIGTPGRVPENSVVGFSNAVLIVDELSGDMSFKELLLTVRQTILDAYARQSYPYHLLIKDLNFDDITDRCPLFDVAFVLEGFHSEMPEVRNDITLAVGNHTESLTGKIFFREDMFRLEEIKAFAEQFINVLASGVTNTDLKLAEIGLITDAERRLIAEHYTNHEERLDDRLIHRLFEDRALQNPEAEALVYKDHRMSYSELNSRANRLARYLRDYGVQPDMAVGICLASPLDAIVAIFAVLKSGGAYVPLDPAFPPDFLLNIFEDAGLGLVIVDRITGDRQPASHILCVDIDTESANFEDLNDANLDVNLHPENLSYLIPTSGSTGRPKIVSVSHNNLVHSTMARFSNYSDCVGRYLLLSSFSFDSSIAGIFWTLCQGGTLCLSGPEQRRDPSWSLDAIAEMQVTHLLTVPSLWGAILQAAVPHQLLSLQVVITAGERLLGEIVKLHYSKCSGAKLVNEYGPTEATVWATAAEIHSTDRSPVIGRPIPSTQVYVVDAFLGLVGKGVPGELCIAGSGVVRGYNQRPDLTATSFIPCTGTGVTPGGRMYRTGDIVRWIDDQGTLEYLGRADRQVKIRGFRVEISEIELVLRKLAGVRDVVVTASAGPDGGPQLNAYVVPEPPNDTKQGELRTQLRERLPEHMIPAGIIFLQQLPMLPNGKLDRNKLLELATKDPAFGDQLPASTPIEEIVSGIWSALLNRKKIGREDNFFEIGGHSLLATQAVSRIREAFAVDLPLQQIFDTPTLSGLAAAIALLHSRNRAAETQLRRRESKTAPLSFAQQRLWFLEQLEPGSAFYNIPIALRLKGFLNLEAIQQSLNQLAIRHEVLRTRFEVVDGVPRQIVEPQSIIHIRVKELQDIAENEREHEAGRIGREEVRKSFDLKKTPLVRALLLPMAEHDHILIVTVHHIICDGWSLEVMVREMAILYERYAGGGNGHLPELPVQYADYSLWQQEWLRSEISEGHLRYWTDALAGTTTLDLPTDRIRPPIQSYQGAMIWAETTPLVTSELRRLSREQGTTLFMMLLAAFQVLLYRYTNQTDITIGTPVANRTRRELEPLLGFFVNELALRGDLSGNPSFRQILIGARRTFLQAYIHQEIPFDIIVKELLGHRDPSRHPLFQVSLVLQNAQVTPLELIGLQVTPFILDTGTSKLDITLFVYETESHLDLMIEYNTALFQTETIEVMMHDFNAILQTIVKNPDLSLQDLCNSIADEDKNRRTVQRRHRHASMRASLRNFVSS